MNGPTSSPVSTPTVSREELVAQIDASCRVLLLPILSALVWVFISSLFMLVTSVKLHSPAILANCAWLTYGHSRPAANDAFVYGFASQAGLAIALWLICRLGRTTLVGTAAIVIASVFWNLGVTIGIIAILSGHTTGFEWLEFPSAASAILIASYAVLGICALLTMKNRREAELYPSQWYIFAALFWFPWLYTTARLLLIWFPVRGVMQLAINGWFANGLFTLWLTALALAVLFYFIPKLVNAPLHSRTLAVFGFWSLALFGGFGGLNGFYRGLPLPAWMVSVGIAATVISLVPLIATVSNLWITLGQGTASKGSLLGYFKTSLLFFALTGVFAVFAATVPQLRLTLFGEGVEQLALYGFIGLTFFGAIHYLAPRLTSVENEKFICASGGAVTLGILIYAVAFIIGGMIQQRRLMDGSIPFLNVMNGAKPFIRISTLGVLLIAVGNALILVRLLAMARECCRNCCKCCCADEAAPANLKPAEVVR
jgi:cytochrome c oxidase cbb3-type subunit 1